MPTIMYKYKTHFFTMQPNISRYTGKYGTIVWTDIQYKNNNTKYVLTVSNMINLLDLYYCCNTAKLWETDVVIKIMADADMTAKDMYQAFVEKIINAKVKTLLQETFHNDLRHMILSEDTKVSDVLSYYSSNDSYSDLDYEQHQSFIDAVIHMENSIHTINSCTITEL